MQDLKLEPGSFKAAKSGRLSSDFDAELHKRNKKWWKIQLGKKDNGKAKDVEVQHFSQSHSESAFWRYFSLRACQTLFTAKGRSVIHCLLFSWSLLHI